MPRANLTRCFHEQRELRESILSEPRGQEIIKSVREQLDTGAKRISTDKLATILNVPAESLISTCASIERLPGKRVVSEHVALEAVLRYLPKTLGWRTVANLAKEIGEHRNTVESVARQYGKPGMMLIASDHKMYISPAGVRLVKRKQRELRFLSSYEYLTNVARELGIAQNLARSYFHNRKITLQRDLHGRLRLSPEQRQDLIRWRFIIQAWREKASIAIGGVTYRHIEVVAKDKVDLLEPAGTRAHEQRLKRETGMLRFFCSNAREQTRSAKLSQYVTTDVSEAFRSAISLHEAGQLLNLSKSTLQHWRKRRPWLAPAGVPGKKTTDLHLPTLLAVASEQYEREPKLTRRPVRPVALLALPLQAAALKAGIDYRTLVKSLPAPKMIHQALLRKRGSIPREGYEKLRQKLVMDPEAKNRDNSFVSATSYLLQAFKPSTPVGSHTDVQAAVELAAFRRGTSVHTIYQDAVDIFSLDNPWPTSFHQLLQKGHRKLAFPLIFMCYLNAITDPRREIIIYGRTPASKTPNKGDIFIHPGIRDFGFIRDLCEKPHGTCLKVAFMSSGQVREVELGTDA